MDHYDKALRHALMILDGDLPPTPEQVRQAASLSIALVKATLPSGILLELDEAHLVRQLESMVTWRVGRDFVIDSDEDHQPWLPNRHADIGWRFWDRYRTYLLTKSHPLAPEVVKSIDRLTDKVLERLEDPRREGPWDRRGMIVGHVQSGKTSNFVGLTCKAADSGYKVIVVLAGLHENLRSQTQMRVDEGFLGYSAAEATTFATSNQPIGVGKVPTSYRAAANSLTGYRHDFSGAKARGLNISPFGQDPVILVVKKHKTILSNLISWLAGYAEMDPDHQDRLAPLPDVPLLVIDDEADNASINTKAIPTDPMTGQPLPEYDVTAINGKIRQLLSLFSKSSYVGYTATPFANIFIHPDDRSEGGTIVHRGIEASLPFGEGLFPRSFIISLPTPTNYVGPSTIFGVRADAEAGILEDVAGLPVVREVDDSDAWLPRKHRGGAVPGALPDSLREAIRAFVLCCAARTCRGQGGEHNSMLVHVTRFVAVQQRVQEQVGAELEDIKQRLRYGDGMSKKQLLEEMEELWSRDFVPTSLEVARSIDDPEMCPVTWESVQVVLQAAAQKVTVKRISGDSMDVLDYQNAVGGTSVIAVGGDKLSRGLTLEGLSVSYFLRPSKMYDTLMQMGRWFGYRPGYLDLCRLYTNGDLIEWYQHIALAGEELRNEFELMVGANRTPRDYGLRIRSHPNGLWITSLIKMREAQTLTVSFDGRVSETTVLFKDSTNATKNLEATNRLLKALPVGASANRRATSSIVWRDVPGALVLGFLREYRTHPHAPKVNSALLAHYLISQMTAGRLVSWTVVLVSSNLSGAVPCTALEYPVHLIQRTPDVPVTGTEGKFAIGRLLSPADERYGLEPAQIAAALEDTRRTWGDRAADRRSKTEPTEPSGPSLRRQRAMESGLLLLYPLDPSFAKLDHEVPIVGMGISFPGDRLNPSMGVEYEANLVYIGRDLADEEFE